MRARHRPEPPTVSKAGAPFRRFPAVLAMGTLLLAFATGGLRLLADCASFGLPFTDLGAETGFCAAIAEAYYAGLTNGTSATTYGPSSPVTRDQMAAFITRTLDQSLLRGTPRAALDQWWMTTPLYEKGGLGLTTVGNTPQLLKSDGTDVWVGNYGDGTVSRVLSSGANFRTWPGVTAAGGILAAMGKIFVAESTAPGSLAMIDPTQNDPTTPPTVATLGDHPIGIAFDGARIWTTDLHVGVSIVTPGATTPWDVTTVTTGFNDPVGILFDGNHVWVTDLDAGTLLKLDGNGAILQTVVVGNQPDFPVFDGHNIWVPNSADDSLTVVRASDGAVLKTFSAANGNQNGLSIPQTAAFDGQRILVTNFGGGISIFRATDLTPISHFDTPGVSGPFGACSDGRNFWVSFQGSAAIGRF